MGSAASAKGDACAVSVLSAAAPAPSTIVALVSAGVTAAVCTTSAVGSTAAAGAAAGPSRGVSMSSCACAVLAISATASTTPSTHLGCILGICERHRTVHTAGQRRAASDQPLLMSKGHHSWLYHQLRMALHEGRRAGIADFRGTEMSRNLDGSSVLCCIRHDGSVPSDTTSLNNACSRTYGLFWVAYTLL